MPIQGIDLQFPVPSSLASVPPAPGPGPRDAGSQLETPPFEPVEETPSPAHAPVAGGHETATLHLLGGASNLDVVTDPALVERFAAHFEGPQPEVTEWGSEITIRYHGGPFSWGRCAAHVRLRPDLAWALRIRGGISRGDLDLSGLELRALEITGGVSRLDLTLGRPDGAVPVDIHGGVSRAELRRPSDVAVHLEVRGGASRLALDTQQFGAVGGCIRLETPTHRTSSDRYDIRVGGGASRFSVQPR